MVPECGGVVLSARHGAACDGMVLGLMLSNVLCVVSECDGMVPECGGVVLSVMVWCQSVVVLC